MEEELNNEDNLAEYTQGFNWGYIIAEHEPELAHELKDGIEHKNDFDNGIYHGINQFLHEKEKSRMDEIDKLLDKGKDKERDI